MSMWNKTIGYPEVGATVGAEFTISIEGPYMPLEVRRKTQHWDSWGR